MKVGVVYNPNAGDRAFRERAAPALAQVLAPHRACCTAATASYLGEVIPRLEQVGREEVHHSPLDSVAAGELLLDVDCILVLGGDGTVADVLAGQRRAGKQVPVLCLGCGTANVGPFVLTTSCEELAQLDLEALRPEEVCGVDVLDGAGVLLGTAFHDVVFSETVVSTVEGAVTTVAAGPFLRGERVPRTPGPIATPSSRLAVNGREVVVPFPVGQIIASPIFDRDQYRGRAVHGKLCWIPYSDQRYVMSIFAEPVIRMTTADDLAAWRGLLSAQFIFGDEDWIEVAGMRGYAIIDGNPRLAMEESGALTCLRPQPAAGKTLRPARRR